MKQSLVLLALLISGASFGQFYYKDIVDARATNDKIKAFLSAKVASVTATGVDSRGAKAADFMELQEINAAQNLLKVSTRNGQSVVKMYYRFNAQGQLSSIADSTRGIKSLTTYTYSGNNITQITTEIKDSLNDFTETEVHQWLYNSSGKPEKMWKIVNDKDSMEYRFTIDDKGNVADEQWFRRGTGIDPWYYYYDEQNRLTDIVRYNKRAKKLLPDFMFEYDEQNRVIQKITTLSTTSPDYLTWRYLYNDKGLKTKEALFNKQKELTGRIDYSYTFLP
ncbi:MAG: hypothetical protein EOO01_37545 [Chitinophagaceae bacterium]|nr:MAG: hypothetical protein EOO01_37545 [Chitinophagaceae bacterium]